MENQSVLLSFKGAAYRYHSDKGETLAIKNLNLDIMQGEFISVIGPSGCGKTTMLSLCAGLLKASEGEILFENKPVAEGNSSFGYMLQRDELFNWLTVKKNVLLPLDVKKIKDADMRKRALELAEKYGLGDFLSSYPDELSGGMRQRVALIRTLSFQPKLLLLDEPFSALDYQTRLDVCNDVYSIIKSEKKTAVLVTHDISEAISLSDRIAVLSKRPAELVGLHTLGFDKSVAPLSRREMPEFSRWFERLWRELHL